MYALRLKIKTAKSYRLEVDKNRSRASNKLRRSLSSFYLLELEKEPVTILDMIDEAKKAISALQKDTISKFSIPAINKLKRIRRLLNQILKANTANLTRIHLMKNSFRIDEISIIEHINSINELINRIIMAQDAQTAFEAALQTNAFQLQEIDKILQSFLLRSEELIQSVPAMSSTVIPSRYAYTDVGATCSCVGK